MADKDKEKQRRVKVKKIKSKRNIKNDDFSTPTHDAEKSLDEWDSYQPTQPTKESTKKKRDRDKKSKRDKKRDKEEDPKKLLRRQRSKREDKRSKKRDSKSIKTDALPDTVPPIKRKSSAPTRAQRVDSGSFGTLKTYKSAQIIAFGDETAIGSDGRLGQIDEMHHTTSVDDSMSHKSSSKLKKPKSKHRQASSDLSSLRSTVLSANRQKSAPSDSTTGSDAEAKAKKKEERLAKLREHRKKQMAEKEEEAKRLRKQRKRARSKGHKEDDLDREAAISKPQESAEERAARKEREKEERIQRLNNMRKKHENKQKEKENELMEFLKKRDEKRYTHSYNAYPPDTETAKQLLYPVFPLEVQSLCPIPKFKYDPNGKEKGPILNSYGFTITHYDCLMAFYKVDKAWKGWISKSDFIDSIKTLLRVQEWDDDKIVSVWTALLKESKDITKQMISRSNEEQKENGNNGIVDYDVNANPDGMTLVDFVNGLHVVLREAHEAIYDFYYLLLGAHYFDSSLAEEDDWHSDLAQNTTWFKQFGERCNYLYTEEHGKSLIGAYHGLLEYRAICCSLMNVDFIPPLEKHSDKVLSGFLNFLAGTVAHLKLFKYEWFQAEVLVAMGKLCIMRSDIMYSRMSNIKILLKECDRVLTMQESKVLVQLALHLQKRVVVDCPSKHQDLLLKELSGLITLSSYRNRPFIPLNFLLLNLLVGIDNYSIQNSKTWQKLSAVPVFACSHENPKIHELGIEVLWRIYTFMPTVGEDVLSNQMDKKKAKSVRKELEIEKYWSEQSRQRTEMKTVKIYTVNDPIPEHWTKMSYNPASSDMSPARLWSMMQQQVYGDVGMMQEHPSMPFDDFVKGLVHCQSYLRESSIRALFQCIPRRQRPWLTKQEFVGFMCGTWTSPNRRHYALRLKELLTIIEDVGKTKEAEKKRIAEQRALAREEKRRKRREKREKEKEEKREAKRKREMVRMQKEREKLAKLEEERMKADEAEQEKERQQKEAEELQRQQEREQKRTDPSSPETSEKSKDSKDSKDSKERRKKKRDKKKKRKNKGAAPPLDTSIAALEESVEQEVVRQSPSASSSVSVSRRQHTKKQTREEEVMADLVSLLDMGDEGDSYDDEIDSVSKRGSDNESVISDAYAPSMSYQSKTPRRKRISSVSSQNSALNTPTFARGKSHFGGDSGFDTPSMTPGAGGMGHQSAISWGGSDLGSVIDGMAPDGHPSLNDNMSVFGYSEIGDEEEDRGLDLRSKVCGITRREIQQTLDLNAVYAQRSRILFDEEMLSKKFSKKMGKEFCLNAAATKLIFVAGLQDKGCTLDNAQLERVHEGVEQFLPRTEYDLPHAVAKWVTTDSTEEDQMTRFIGDDQQWESSKHLVPTYLRHEMVAFVVGETYFDLINPNKKEMNKRRKKGEPVIHRNLNYIGSCIEEMHDVNLPKKQYLPLICGFARKCCGDDKFQNIAQQLLYCISFYLPLSDAPPDEEGKLVVSCLVLDRTWHPEKLNADQGYNEYDSIRVQRTGRITGIPFEHDTGNGGVLLLKVYGELFIERHATVDTDSCGYSGGWQYNCQGDSIYRCGKTHKKCNFGGGGGGYYGAGGGYGSKGQTPKSDNRYLLSVGEGGRTYGDRLVHVRAYMGSGGGSGGGKFLYSRGGRGGGIVCIVAGSIHNKGRIMSLGQRGRYLAGSGSGGSIVIECNSYYHYGKGAILASSLEPYPDVEKKGSGGCGGYGRVAIKINRQRWTTDMKKAICTSDGSKIWTAAAWIHPLPKWVGSDKMNERRHLKPKIVGCHPMSRIMDTVYKHCARFRLEDDEDDDDGPLVNIYCPDGEKEHKEVETYRRRKEKEKKALYDWKFEEFALDTKQGK